MSEKYEHNKLTKIVWVFLIIMALLSFSNLIKIEIDGELIKPAGLTVIVGIIAFFVTSNTNSSKDEGFEFKSFPKKLADVKVIILLLVPAALNVVTWFLTNPLIPGYMEHLKSRTAILNPEKLIPMVITLIVAALGEEISSRAFFQKQTTKAFGFVPSIFLTSLIFAAGHFNYGEPVVVAYDLLLVFANSFFYGMVFYKTDNAWCSWVSHLLANVVGVILMYA